MPHRVPHQHPGMNRSGAFGTTTQAIDAAAFIRPVCPFVTGWEDLAVQIMRLTKRHNVPFRSVQGACSCCRAITHGKRQPRKAMAQNPNCRQLCSACMDLSCSCPSPAKVITLSLRSSMLQCGSVAGSDTPDAS